MNLTAEQFWALVAILSVVTVAIAITWEWVVRQDAARATMSAAKRAELDDLDEEMRLW